MWPRMLQSAKCSATVGIQCNIHLHKFFFTMSTSMRIFDHAVYDFSSFHCHEYSIINVYDK